MIAGLDASCYRREARAGSGGPCPTSQPWGAPQITGPWLRRRRECPSPSGLCAVVAGGDARFAWPEDFSVGQARLASQEVDIAWGQGPEPSRAASARRHGSMVGAPDFLPRVGHRKGVRWSSTMSLLHSCIPSCISSAFHPPLASPRLLASRHRPRNASETPDWRASASAIEIPHVKCQACRRVRASPSSAPASQASPRPTSSQRRAQTCG